MQKNTRRVDAHCWGEQPQAAAALEGPTQGDIVPWVTAAAAGSSSGGGSSS